MASYTYKAYAIDYTTGDFLGETGTLEYVYDVEVVRQNLWQAMNVNKGEWFADIDEGIPYVTGGDDGFLGSVGQDYLVEDTVKKRILEIEGVVSITEFSMENNQGSIKIDFTVTTVFTENITLQIAT